MARRAFAALLLGVASGALAQPQLSSVQALMLLDTTGQLDIGAVVAQFAAGNGQAVQTQAVMPIANGQAVWYRLSLPAVSSNAAQLLVLPHPGLDSADLYTVDTTKSGSPRWDVQRSGDARAVADWAVSNLYPAFKLPDRLGARAPAYLRVTNIYPASVSWALVDAAAFQNHIKRWYLLLGVYIGVVILIVVVTCVQGVIWQEPIHFLLACFVVAAALSQLALTGLAGEYFWPNLAWWNDRSLGALPIASSMLLHLFFHRLLAERAAVWALYGFVVMLVLGALVLAGSLAPNRAPFMAYFAPYYTLSLLAYLAAAAWYTWRTPRVGFWLLAGVVCLSSGALFPILRLVGAVPSTIATQFGAQAGAALLIPLLLVALFFRSRERRANLLRVGSMERTDPLTGMGNHRVLLQQLERLSRSTGGAAVVRIRLSNVLAIRQEYGLDVAQASVVQVGALAAAAVPEGDSVARHREGDLVLLLSGPVTRDWLSVVGQRLIARGLGGAPGLPKQVSLQLKIAVLMAPFDTTEPTMLLQFLESLIDGMGQRSGTGLRFATRSAATTTTATL